MKSKISFLVTLWSVILALCLGLLIVLFGEKETRESEKENRMLQGMPSATVENLLSGEFSTGFEGYLSDSFFARNFIINCSEKLLGVFSAATEEDLLLLEGGDDELQGLSAGTSPSPDTQENDAVQNTDEPDISGTPSADDSDGIEDISDLDNNADDELTSDEAPDEYGFFRRTKDGKLEKSFSTYPGRRKAIADALNKYRAVLPEDGSVYYMMIPLKRNYTPVVNNDRYTGWYSNTEDALSELTDDGVYIINAPEILEPHLEEDIYFPLDHHWSALGAYYVCEEIITMQGLPMTPYNEYSYKTSSGANVSSGEKGWFEVLYPLNDVTADKLYSGRAEKTTFMNYNSTTYMAYLGGITVPWSRYTTGFDTGRNALVIGDSFANVFAPYLCPYYDEIHMTDVRENYYDSNKAGGWIASLIKKHDIDDVYIIMSYANAANSVTSFERLEYCLYGK